MDDKPLLSKALALEPLGAPTGSGAAARVEGDPSAGDTKAQRDVQIMTSDEFLARAAKEYQKGHVDQALWRRATEQGSDDPSLVVAAYLRTRAAALQMQHKLGERSQIQARGAGSKRGETRRKGESEPREEIVSTKFVGVRTRDVKSKVLYSAGAVAALVSAVVLVYVMVLPEKSEPVRPPTASVAAKPPDRPAAPPASRSEQAVVKNTTAGNSNGPEATFGTSVTQLKSDGKWNVLVLYATEWTRREPDNAAAWYELSIGFAKLLQYGDALDAATKAARLSPGDPLLWRNLGHLNLEVDRLPEAGLAFAEVLAVLPDDADARCGAALVAQRQARPKDSTANVRQVKPVDTSCPDASRGDTTAVIKVDAEAHKPKLSVGR